MPAGPPAVAPAVDRRSSMRRIAEVIGPLGQAVEGDERGRRLGCQHRHPRRGGMNAQQQRLELEPAVARDDDLAVQHEARRRSANRAQGLEQLREVAVQRLQVARLEVQLRAVAKHEGPKTIPFRLVAPSLADRQLGRRLGQHRLDRGLNGKRHVADHTRGPASSILAP